MSEPPNSAYFERAFQLTVGHEGGLSLDPFDHGNWTGGAPGKGLLKGSKFGVSARSYPNADIAKLTLDDARDIARRDYWGPARCDLMAWPVCAAVFDMAYHSGPETARRTLQAALGVAPDGVIGRLTLAALNSQPPVSVLVKYHAERVVFMAGAPTWPTHRRGWMRRMFGLTLELMQP